MLDRRWVIAATDPLHPDAAAQISEVADLIVLGEDDLSEQGPPIPGIDALIVRRHMGPDWLTRCPGLRVMVRHGVGMDFLPVNAATERGIACGNTPGVNANTVAEYVMGSLLLWERRFDHFHTLMAEGQWLRMEAKSSRELAGATLGIVGFGNIGQRIAEMASEGFRMRVAVHTRTEKGLPASVRTMSLQELFVCSDYVVLCCPLTDDTLHLINRKLLEHTNRDLVLVNVSRGPVIDDGALAAALDAGRMRGAILDVHATHPMSQNSPLFNHPKVSHTPHIAGITARSESTTSRAALTKALDLLQHSLPKQNAS